MTTPVFGLPVSNFVSLYKIAFLNICLICIVVKKAGSIGEDFKISITSICIHLLSLSVDSFCPLNDEPIAYCRLPGRFTLRNK